MTVTDWQALRLQTDPAKEPVSLEEAKDQLRILHNDEDAYIAWLIGAAREAVEEDVLRRALITQTWDVWYDNWPAFPVTLPRPPLQSVEGVFYTPDGGSEQEYSSSNYVVDANSEPGRILLEDNATLPSDELESGPSVRIRFVAGYGDDASDVPTRVRQGLLLLVAELYEQRQPTVIGQGNSRIDVPWGIKRMLQGERRWVF